MSLTKEDCNACLNYDKNMSPTVRKCFKQLIKEHFDNPPLKFEDIHDFMPVFDVTTGFWIMITSVINGNSFGGYVFNRKNGTMYFNLFTFEENRFYRNQLDSVSRVSTKSRLKNIKNNF